MCEMKAQGQTSSLSNNIIVISSKVFGVSLFVFLF